MIVEHTALRNIGNVISLVYVSGVAYYFLILYLV
jgi:hypothetical protein